MFVKIDEMRGVLSDAMQAFYDKINVTSVKRFYLALEFNKINNPEFQNDKLYPLEMMPMNNRNPIYTPQINGISLHMPSTPVLYQWPKISRVCLISFVYSAEISN
jgi:hypothetical protein